MKRALLLIRPQPNYRREAFESGVRAAGFGIVTALQRAEPGDLLVTWNRYGAADAMAHAVEAAGAAVIVVENGYLGRDAAGQKLYAMQRSMLHGFGPFHVGEGDRLAALGVQFKPWRTGGSEVIVLAQRGIGVDPVRSTPDDAQRVASAIRRATGLPVRIRAHPGDREPEIPLADDLARAAFAVCHTSAAGLHALVMGVPVVTTAERWLGRPAASYVPAGDLAAWRDAPARLVRDDALRSQTFHRVAWAQWTVDEIKTGEPICHLCSSM